MKGFLRAPVFEYSILLALTVITLLLYGRLQPQIQFANGLGWDGVEYAKIFSAFREHITRHDIAFPFCQRIGVPFLAAALPTSNTIVAFKIINAIAGGIFSLLIYAIGREAQLGRYYSSLAFLITLLHFFSPLRFTAYYPVYTDPLFLALSAAAFLALLKRKLLFCYALLLLAYPVREATLYIAPFFGIATFYLYGYKKEYIWQFVALMCSLLIMKLSINTLMDCHGSQFITAFSWIYRRLSDPQSFITFFAAVSLTAAPIAYLSPFGSLNRIEKISLFALIMAAFLSWVGGTDTTRIFFSFFPLYFIVIFSTIKKQGFIFSLFCLSGYLIVNQAGRKILEPLHNWPMQDESGFFWQFPDHARPEVSLMILAVWLLLFGSYQKISALFKKQPS